MSILAGKGIFPASPALLQEFRATDPEEFLQLAPRGVQHQMVLRGKGSFEARRRRSASPSLIVSRGSTSLDVTHRTGTGPFAFFTLVSEDDAPSVMHGRQLRPGTLALCRPGAEVHSQSPAGATWWNICFPAGILEQGWTALSGLPFEGPRETVEIVQVPPGIQDRLRAGMNAALSAREHDPVLVDELLRLALHAFPPTLGSPGDAESDRFPSLARQSRAVDGLVAIADRTDGPHPLTAVCAELGVPLRTLNAYSNALLGMGAGQYLRRRRLHRVLAALRQGGTRVTDAAVAEGFWELGRFAADYRTLFGSTPSETLRGQLISAA